MGSRGKAPVAPEAEAVCRQGLQILTAKTIKIEKVFAQFLILDEYVLR